MDCPMCDGLGMVQNPQRRPNGLKKCPECDTPPSPYFLPLAAWLDQLDDDDRAAYAAAERRHAEAVRAEERAVLAHAQAAPADCRCRWCTVRPAVTAGRAWWEMDERKE
jgi:hypothetical protein